MENRKKRKLLKSVQLLSLYMLVVLSLIGCKEGNILKDTNGLDLLFLADF